MNNVQEILSHWPVIFSGFGDNSLIAGSPNRTENRFLFHDEEGIFYIAEGYSPRKQQYQIRQNRLLEFLAENLVPGIHPFYRTLSGEHGVLSGGLFWQIKPYIEAEKVPRETLGERADFGRLWADFLLQMKTVVDRSMEPPPMPEQPFFMADFLPVLQRHAERKMPEITDRLQEIAQRLIPFFKWERKADLTLAHGDFHPGNILMGQGMIRVVIDWEFAGAKFPGYDMALLIGCLAMDHPDNLFSPAVCALRNTLYANRYLPDDAWERLPQMIAATRLGWLGEWLTLEDKALVAQELELISILLDGDFAKESTLKGWTPVNNMPDFKTMWSGCKSDCQTGCNSSPFAQYDNAASVLKLELKRTSQSWDGAPLPDYLKGKPELVVMRYIFPVGSKLPWHHHPVINYGILHQGELTIIGVDGKKKVVHAGEAIVEMVGSVHYGMNTGDKPVVLDMFYLSLEGMPLAVQHPDIPMK